jgi:acetyl esterase/lipase
MQSRARWQAVAPRSAVSSWLRCLTSKAQGFSVDPSLFSPAAIPTEVAELNARVEAAAAAAPLLSASSPQVVRVQRAQLFSHEPRRIDENIPGLDGSAPPVGIAIFEPRSGAAKASYLHFHGGGFIIGSAYGQNDARLQQMADDLDLAVVSVDYRLAPESQWPLPLDDCYAAALWLIRHGTQRLGTAVRLIGGESAGAHLCLCTLLRLRDEQHLTALPPPDELFRAVNLVRGRKSNPCTSRVHGHSSTHASVH